MFCDTIGLCKSNLTPGTSGKPYSGIDIIRYPTLPGLIVAVYNTISYCLYKLHEKDISRIGMDWLFLYRDYKYTLTLRGYTTTYFHRK